MLLYAHSPPTPFGIGSVEGLGTVPTIDEPEARSADTRVSDRLLPETLKNTAVRTSVGTSTSAVPVFVSVMIRLAPETSNLAEAPSPPEVNE